MEHLQIATSQKSENTDEDIHQRLLDKVLFCDPGDISKNLLQVVTEAATQRCS